VITGPVTAERLCRRHDETDDPGKAGTMTESGTTRVAVYLDFDNIVISRYDQVHGRNSFQRDKTKGLEKNRLELATVDVGAIIDFASSFGTLVLTRAYADWSADVNAAYHGQLVGRAVDLVQLFPAAAYGKNGADIRLAVDAVEDMFRLPDLTHVVIVGGDSDYIALAQRCKRLGRYVVGIGVAGASSRSLAAACDEFVTYDALPGIPPAQAPEPKRRGRRPSAVEPDDEPAPADPQAAATGLLERALRIGQEKEDAEWLHNSAVKAQMKRMDPSFSEKALGFKSFSDFLRSRSDLVDLDETSTTRMVRLHTEPAP
jgi:NYN domain/OST-HTH/LOTUS domain